MIDLRLHGAPIATVFDLLGKKENDITYSLGWALSRSTRLTRRLITTVCSSARDPGEIEIVRLQEFLPAGGFTDVEVVADRAAVIIEAKRGWTLPTNEQLQLYARRLISSSIAEVRLVVVSECSPDFAKPRLPGSALGVAVAYLSWSQVAQLVTATANSTGTHAEKRLLREFDRYLRGLMTMQNQSSNRVYVVSVGSTPTGWSGTLTPIQIVTEKNRYFHQIGGGYPKEPPNYIGFRWGGRLQQICHVEGYEVITDPHPHFPEIPSQEWKPTYLYELGAPIRPAAVVRTGNLYRAQRVWAAIDLLLTCGTIAEARDRTQERDRRVGHVSP